MGILCEWFGHRFTHDGSRASGSWSRQWYGNTPLTDWYRTLCVPKTCDRCGHTNSDSFVVPAGWADKPEEAERIVPDAALQGKNEPVDPSPQGIVPEGERR